MPGGIMKIIIVGCGNVGETLAEQLSKEGHDITVVDTREQLVTDVSNANDVLGIVGNGTSYNILQEAGVSDADLMIAVTGFDELNLLSCLMARKAGGCNTIARVSNPIYSSEIGFLKEELGISMIINPHLATAREMARLLKFPSALNVDSFAKSRVEIVSFKLEEDNPLCNVQLKHMRRKLECDFLIPVVEREDEVIIPSGEFELKAGDEISMVGSQKQTMKLFKKMKLPVSAAKNAMIVGGGRATLYLAKQLIEMGVKVKIIDRDEKRCEVLKDALPKAMILCGDGTEKDLLMEEGLMDADVFVANTNFDEENVMLTLFAKSVSKAKLITKIHRISYDEIIEKLDLGSIVYPKYIMAERILKYVRAMKNSIGSEIESLHRLNDNKVEALEFLIKEDSPIANIPLKDLKLKDNMLIGCITHKGQVEIPNGDSIIKVGDTVILIATHKGLHDIRDALV
jgi:trk system potassium uptake protein TrkA